MCVASEEEVFVVVPPVVRSLRTLRLVAAEAGCRAGLDVSEIGDLRIAVDELAHALLEATRSRITVGIGVDGPWVDVHGSARRSRDGSRPRLSCIAELMVDAATDNYQLGETPTRAWFSLRKVAGSDRFPRSAREA